MEEKKTSPLFDIVLEAVLNQDKQGISSPEIIDYLLDVTDGPPNINQDLKKVLKEGIRIGVLRLRNGVYRLGSAREVGRYFMNEAAPDRGDVKVITAKRRGGRRRRRRRSRSRSRSRTRSRSRRSRNKRRRRDGGHTQVTEEEAKNDDKAAGDSGSDDEGSQSSQSDR